jgi:hypothetical protein
MYVLKIKIDDNESSKHQIWEKNELKGSIHTLTHTPSKINDDDNEEIRIILSFIAYDHNSRGQLYRDLPPKIYDVTC